MPDMPREPNWFEKILGIIPGYKGYRAREAGRESDAILRREIAGKLDKAKLRLNDAVNELTSAGRLDLLDPIGQLQSLLGRLADTIRLAPRGASGWLDDYAIDGQVLDRMYEVDLQVAESAVRLVEQVDGITPGDEAAEQVRAAREAAQSLEDAFERRRELLSGSAQGTDGPTVME